MRGQAEALVPMIEAVMAEAAADYGNLDVIAVTIGPGAFTGLRIGLATARAFSLAAGTPLFGVSSFDAVLAGAPVVAPDESTHKSVLVALETKRADIYAQMFDTAGAPVSDPAAVEETALAEFAGAELPVLVMGDGAERALKVLEAGGVVEGLFAVGNCSAAILPTYPGPGATLGPAMTMAYQSAKLINGVEG